MPTAMPVAACKLKLSPDKHHSPKKNSPIPLPPGM